MLTRLSVKNFRLLRDVTIDVEPGKPIVLIGPNGAGKSSVIQVLDLLGRFATEGFKEAMQALGGGRALATANSNEVTFEVTTVAAMGYEPPFPLRYRVAFKSYSGVAAEWMQSQLDGTPPSQDVERTEGSLSLLNARTGEKDEQKLGSGAESKLAFELVKQQSFYWMLDELQRRLADICAYNGFLTTPLWARDVREGRFSPFDGVVLAPCPRIDSRGLDLINALHYLQSSHPDEWDELERNFKAEFPFVQRLEFPADPAGGRIGLAWRDRRYPGVRMHGHQMSEGMATYLCLLAAILTPEPATAIAFDEPDRHLHPSALRRVAHLLERLSERTAVFVATHSDRFLDYLSDPAGSLRVCEPSNEGVTIRPLDREALDAWRAEYTLSELRERGHLDPSNASAVEP